MLPKLRMTSSRRQALKVGAAALMGAWLPRASLAQGKAGKQAVPHAAQPTHGPRLRLAVLGDSDSHSYHDYVLIPRVSGKRGGKWRDATWQWTELLARLRPGHVDQGAWGTWGTGPKIAEALDWIGWGGRAPRKQDFRYNFAFSGAEAHELMSGPYRQAPRLRSLLDGERGEWQGGIVVLRIGVNDIGQPPELERYAREGITAGVREDILRCARWMRQAVELLASAQSSLRFVLVGICDNSHLPSVAGRWRTPRERANIAAALDIFDEEVRNIALADPGRVFFDDRAWFARWWGGRDSEGHPAYRSVDLDGRRAVRYASGDEPWNAILADEHAGSVWNGLWAADLVRLLNERFGLGIPPISLQEIAGLVAPGAAWNPGP